MRVTAWTVHAGGTPMVLEERDEQPGPGEALVEVAGCGVCHTDLGFFYDGVPTRHGFPLTLGHEVSGTVVEAGAGAEDWLGRQVVVPAVTPCGEVRGLQEPATGGSAPPRSSRAATSTAASPPTSASRPRASARCPTWTTRR